jgi:hypothetical protein
MLRCKMQKIRISKVSKQSFIQKGFDSKGCTGAICNDLCCRYGVDFDHESYDLLISNRILIEKLVSRRIEDCFETRWSNDKEFLGKNAIRCLTNNAGYCFFHKIDGRGCVLYELSYSKNISRRIIPSICRLFPLTWESGELYVYNEKEEYIKFYGCNCFEPENITSKNLFESQKNEIEDIFEVKL